MEVVTPLALLVECPLRRHGVANPGVDVVAHGVLHAPSQPLGPAIVVRPVRVKDVPNLVRDDRELHLGSRLQ
eukprot:1335399-Alexandrium_andersonii.AAC.1